MTQSGVLQILGEHSMQKYYVEYNEFLTNHICHGIIAVHRLGAGSERMQRFINWYEPRLEPPEIHHKYDDMVVKEDGDVLDILGKRVGFYRLLSHYRSLLRQYGSKEELIRREFPKLEAGMVCAAVHGLIHTGYALAQGWEEGICEGLAYLHFSYKPLVYDKTSPQNQLDLFGKGSKSAFEIADIIRQDLRLREAMLKETKLLKASTTRTIGTGQFRMAAIVTNHGDHLIGLANQLQIPALQCKAGDNLDIGALANWLVDVALHVYFAADRRNDFFLLHGVTGAWSLHRLLPYMSRTDVVSCMRTFICTLFAVYLTEDSPRLIHDVATDPPVSQATWQAIIDDVLAQDHDEHIYKLVQVCYEMWKKEPASQSTSLYIAAAKVAQNEPLRFADFAMGEVYTD